MIKVNRLFERWNRGLLFDVCLFLFQLITLRLLTRLTVNFVHHAQEDVLAKTAIALFLLGLFLLQPLGPILKRWSFHTHFKSFENEEGVLTSLLLSAYRFFYIAAMWIMIYLAYSYFISAFPDVESDTLERTVVAGAIVSSVLSLIVIFRYFQKPKRQPRWRFLMTPQAEALGDLCMLLNVICFQLLFSVYVSFPHFSNLLHKITRQATGAFDSFSGRIYLACIAVLLGYFPARIFYLVMDRRKITWLMMLVANLPFIYAVASFAPAPQQPKSLREPMFTVTAAELHHEREADTEAAMKKYRNLTINVTGRVQSRFFPRSLELDSEIGLDGKQGYPWVYCLFDEDQVEIAEALEIGQLVTLQCVGSDNWSRGTVLKHCLLVGVE
jgi:tRNA_anti-like